MKVALQTYAKYLVYSLLSATVVIGKSPLNFTKSDLVHIVNAAWFSVLPVIVKAVNPKDPSLGLGSQK